ncbi:GLPGLI family protein [Niabella soli]|uniref:GLPGLI family protein n=1 Tax=Niabella soli TaxID=446683 RepID=UPI0005C716FD|nr:GLPGLI family protein [Niabella soli]
MILRNTLLITLLLLSLGSSAQKFITSGSITYEARTNVIKSIPWLDENDDFFRQIKDQVPQFSMNYYTLNFSDNKTIYSFLKNTDTKKVPEWYKFSDEDNIWYNDFGTGKSVDKKAVRWDDTYLIAGDIHPQQWRVYPTDNTVIAGFNCRKASTVIFDSVYVFAYYTDEIAVSGGPMGLNGLPGMILGVTIPRLATSWIATSLSLDVAAASITPPVKGGKKKTVEELKTTFNDFKKNWGKEELKYFNPIYWRTFL